jgi:serine/threonine-protein kinase
MSAPTTERNLLFGFLAVQNDFLAPKELVAAVTTWLGKKSRSLGDILRDRKSLSEKERQLLLNLVDQHLARHDGDSEKSLAAVASKSTVCDDLLALGDIDLQLTLSLVLTNPSVASGSAPKRQSTGKSRYCVLSRHAKGGLGEVFIAQDLELNRQVALKEIQRKKIDNPDSRARFMLEAEITSGLEHPGVVPVYGMGKYADGRPYYAMRFIRGESLKKAIDRFHKTADPSVSNADPTSSTSISQRTTTRTPRSAYESLEFRKLLGRFIAVCYTMEYAHSRGVIHRDLKPGNIMLGKYGETLVVDWGLAKIQGRAEQHQNSDEETLHPRSGPAPAVNEINRAIGTPAYMSPEQAAGRPDLLSPASDVYSLGATLYSMLTGQLPFAKGASATEILRRVQEGDFPAPRKVCSTVPPALEAICLKAMSLQPSDRYFSPQILADEIDRYLADEPVTAYREPVLVRARRWVRRHQSLAAAAVATLLLGAVCLAALLIVTANANEKLRLAVKQAQQQSQL